MNALIRTACGIKALGGALLLSTALFGVAFFATMQFWIRFTKTIRRECDANVD